MNNEVEISYRTPSSKLVRIAEIASRYKGRPEYLMKVVTQVQKITPTFTAAVAATIAREMGISFGKSPVANVRPAGREAPVCTSW